MTHGTGGSDSIRAARFLMRMGRSFPIKAQPESAFHFGAGFRDAVSGCMAIGKPRIPFRVIPGHTFRFNAHWETVPF